MDTGTYVGRSEKYLSTKLMIQPNSKFEVQCFASAFPHVSSFNGDYVIHKDTLILTNVNKIPKNLYKKDIAPLDTSTNIYFTFNDENGKALKNIKVTYSYKMIAPIHAVYTDNNGKTKILRKDLDAMRSQAPAYYNGNNELLLEVKVDTVEFYTAWTDNCIDSPQSIYVTLNRNWLADVIIRRTYYKISGDKLIYLKQIYKGSSQIMQDKWGDFERKR